MSTRTRQSESRPSNGTYRHGNDHLIELHNVIKTFQTAAGSFTALKSVSIKVDRGEFVAVIGKSGSGKSTMINMITGIDRPSSSEILVGDTALHTLRVAIARAGQRPAHPDRRRTDRQPGHRAAQKLGGDRARDRPDRTIASRRPGGQP